MPKKETDPAVINSAKRRLAELQSWLADPKKKPTPFGRAPSPKAIQSDIDSIKKWLSKNGVTDELLPVPVNDALSDRAKLERRRDIEAALAHSESIGSRAEELAYRKSVSRSKETQAAGERLYKAIQAARAKLVAEYKELGGDVSRVSDEELKPVPVGDVDYDAKQVDERRRKVFKEAERMYYAADPNASGFPYAPASVRKEWIDKAKKKLGLDSSSAKDSRSPQWQPDSPDKPLLNDLHRSMQKLGYVYQWSGTGPEKGSIKHGYENGPDKGFVVERKNGKHGIGYSKDSKSAKDEVRGVDAEEKVEAYGVKGAKSTKWRKVFANQAAFEKWLDANEGDVEVQGTRKAEDELKPVPVNDTSSIEKYNAARQAESETKLKSPAGEEERQARNAETLKRMRGGKAKDEQLPPEVARLAKQLGSLYDQLENGEDVTDDKFDAVEHKLAQLGYECGTYGPSTGKVWKKEGKAKDALNKRELEDRLTSVVQSFETACEEHPDPKDAEKAGATIKQAKNALKTNSSLQVCSILVSAAYALVNKMYKGAGKDEEPMKSVNAYCPACKSAQTHLLTPEGPKCKRCLAKGKDSPDNLLSTAQDQEIAQDRKRALDSYRKAASAFRSTGDSKQEAVAREGIDECQRKLVGGVDSTYSHPSSGKVQAFDAADRALTSAIQRTRAGERVRMALDSATGETVVEPVK